MSNIQDIRNAFEQRRGRRMQLEHSISGLEDQVLDKKRDLSRHEQAREIIKEVGLATQQQLQVHISDITSLALDAVFSDPYELVVDFVQRRNKTECDLYFARDDMRVEPQAASGGGAVDVAAFALRIAAWSMQSPKKRNVIILDEPMRFLSEDKQEAASQMLKELSDRLGIQFIIVTHQSVLSEYADKVFRVKMKNGKSIVT